jgi:S-methylmethionine-dependent homocysteine/selenocysteine methylase
VITTNSYGCVPFHLGEELYAARGVELARLSGKIARNVAGPVGEPGTVQVAGCLPPPFGSYLPEKFDPILAPKILAELAAAQAPYVDLWIAETMSSIADLEAAAAAASDGKPLWTAFCLADDTDPAAPRLRSGEPLAAAALRAVELGSVAVLINCTRPEIVGEGIRVLVATLAGSPHVQIGAYPNAFETKEMKAVGHSENQANQVLMGMRNIDEDVLVKAVREWVKDGASIIGGCCGIYPEHIAMLAAAKLEAPEQSRSTSGHADKSETILEETGGLGRQIIETKA